MGLTQNGAKSPKWNLFAISRYDDGQGRVANFTKFNVTSPLGNINKALPLKDPNDLTRRVEFRHAEAQVVPLLAASLAIPARQTHLQGKVPLPHLSSPTPLALFYQNWKHRHSSTATHSAYLRARRRFAN